MNQNLKPKLLKDKYVFFRKEHLGYASVISPDDSSKALHLLNPTIVEIAELFTGEFTIEEIRTKYAARYQQSVSSPLTRYVDQTLFILSLYNLVEFEETKEVLPTKGGPIPKVRRLEEWDFIGLRSLFNGGDFPLKGDSPIFHFMHPYVNPTLYSELMLRLRIFNQTEFFYAITTGSKIEFFVSLFDSRPLKPMASIGAIVGTSSYSLEEGMASIIPVLLKEVKPNFHKLEWRYLAGENDYSKLIALMERFGFKQEAALPDEFGPGVQEIIYGNILHPSSGEGNSRQTC